MKYWKKSEKYLVLAAVSSFLALVVASISRTSIWHDEGYSATLIQNSYTGIVSRTALDVHPPLYYLLLKVWSQVFGDSIVTLRLFSAVFMLAAILIAWRIIRKIYGQNKALLALFSMSFGPFLVRYGQEMRMYGLAAFLTMSATYFWLILQNEKKSKLSIYLAYGAIIAAGMYTQYFFILVPIVHLLTYLINSSWQQLWQRFLRLGRFWPSALIAWLLFVWWIPTVVHQYQGVYGSFWIGPVSIESLTSTPLAMLVLKKQFQMTGWLGLLAILILVMVFLAFQQFIRTYKDKSSRLIFGSIILPPLLLFLLSIPPFQPSYQDRYMSFFGPLFYSGLILGLAALVKSKWLKMIPIVVMFAIMIFGQVNNYRFGTSHGWTPDHYFTMNQFEKTVEADYNNEPVYSTSLWTFFDAHATLRDRKVQLLLASYPTNWRGNWSAVYNRYDLMTTDISTKGNGFWLIDESRETKYSGHALDNYQAEQPLVAGYAKLIHYKLK